jgi:hypothetical protein
MRKTKKKWKDNTIDQERLPGTKCAMEKEAFGRWTRVTGKRNLNNRIVMHH